jgi:hypothetical protein
MENSMEFHELTERFSPGMVSRFNLFVVRRVRDVETLHGFKIESVRVFGYVHCCASHTGCDQ